LVKTQVVSMVLSCSLHQYIMQVGKLERPFEFPPVQETLSSHFLGKNNNRNNPNLS
jgi:hypothetical protein